MNYLVAVLPNRVKAEAAYAALAQEGLPKAQINILGTGHKSADDYDFLNPKRQARKQVMLMATWLVPFGIIGGYLFNVSTQYELVSWAGSVGNHILGGVFGALAGAMGSFFAGGSAILSSGGKEAQPYRNRLSQGKYLILVDGSPPLMNQASRILKRFNPETMQTHEPS